MTQNQNNKITRVIWTSLAWVFFSFDLIQLYYRDMTFNFDINILGLLVVGYMLFSDKVINGYVLLANLIFNICIFFNPIGNIIVAIIPTMIFFFAFGVFKFYVLYSAFIYVKRFCVKATRLEVEKKFESPEQTQEQGQVQEQPAN